MRNAVVTQEPTDNGIFRRLLEFKKLAIAESKRLMPFAIPKTQSRAEGRTVDVQWESQQTDKFKAVGFWNPDNRNWPKSWDLRDRLFQKPRGSAQAVAPAGGSSYECFHRLFALGRPSIIVVLFGSLRLSRGETDMQRVRSSLLLVLWSVAFAVPGAIGEAAEPIPHAQDKPPGPALSPEEAIAKMTVPEGFTVELVASEPDIVNPVAMTIDERGRFWITESLEYPRREEGPGGDRIKIVEDTDGDGRADKFTVFAEGFNIPSGIAVGHGGVWVANSPDILFLQDTDGDDKADKQEVVVTGFGRDDTHELPNSLSWGPDGWLYGLNGVFNPSHIEYRGKTYDFTCALFRIHPKTREFQVFCEGTSNPWGVTWDIEGSAFVSACVIDHLWHLTESGYYHRQGGPYPPYTWKMESIVEHKHQKAAYCGIHYFDSDAYPKQYRDKLYMGNIHAGGINVDKLQRDGSTYRGTGEPDFLMANDAWFMPVVQKTGPDGSLYILDWYDRYHCYQDANRDPKGIDRLRGRLYRVRYQDTPRVAKLDLKKESDPQLIERLHSDNIYYRETAQRLLSERNRRETRAQLQKLVLDDQAPRKARMHALWSLVSTGELEDEFHLALLDHSDAGYRAWGVRAAGNFGRVAPEIRKAVIRLAGDPSPDVKLQVAIAARKLEEVDAFKLLVTVLAGAGDDKVIPHIVWQNVHPILEQHAEQFANAAGDQKLQAMPAMAEIMPRAVERLLASDQAPTHLARLLSTMTSGAVANPAAFENSLAVISTKVQNREIAGDQREALRKALAPTLVAIFRNENSPFLVRAALLAAAWNDPAGVEVVQGMLRSADKPEAQRIAALQALVSADGRSVLEITGEILKHPGQHSPRFIGELLASLGRLEQPAVADQVLRAYSKLRPELQPRAIELLTQRPQWSKPLMAAIESGNIAPEVLNVNQLRKLLASKDKDLVALVRKRYGSVRTERNPQREEVIYEVRNMLKNNAGDPHRGQEVFKRVCAQCHKIYGEGQEVGPDITQIGRTSMELLLSNVLDPSLVIGTSYQATSVRTTDGRVLTGIKVEDNEERLALKVQGGKIETIAREDIDEVKVSELSMMPEELEKQVMPQELIDLFAYLSLDKPPSDPTARRLPGFGAPPGQKK